MQLQLQRYTAPTLDFDDDDDDEEADSTNPGWYLDMERSEMEMCVGIIYDEIWSWQRQLWKHFDEGEGWKENVHVQCTAKPLTKKNWHYSGSKGYVHCTLEWYMIYKRTEVTSQKHQPWQHFNFLQQFFKTIWHNSKQCEYQKFLVFSYFESFKF